MEKKILNDFCFHKPKTLDEALVLIDKYQENGLLMEGGSEVIPNMKSLVVTPDHIISLKHIPEFDYITYTPGEGLHIGPSCTLTKVEYDPNVQSVYPSLYMGVHGMSNTNIHNISTVTGNICYAVPSADTAAPLLTLNAELSVKSVTASARFPSPSCLPAFAAQRSRKTRSLRISSFRSPIREPLPYTIKTPAARRLTSQ